MKLVVLNKKARLHTHRIQTHDVLSYFYRVFGYYWYLSPSMYDSSMRKQTSENIQNTLAQIRDNVAYKTEDIVRISSTLYDDEQFVENLKLNLTIAQDIHTRAKKVFEPKLESASKSIGINLRLFIYVKNETISQVYYSYKPGSNFPNQTFNIYHMGRIVNRSWYQLLPSEEYGITMRWEEVENDQTSGRIAP